MTMKIDQSLRNPLAALVALTEQEKIARGLMHTPREIWQQPETWESTYARVSQQRGELQEFLHQSLAKSPTVYLIGAGTSDYVGRALTSVLRQKWQCDVIAIPSTELITNMEDYVLPDHAYLWISFSRSGDSSEGVGVLEMALRRYPQVQHLVVACNKDGKMPQICAGRANACVLLLDDAVNDRGLAMTSSFTNMVVAGQCLANLAALEKYRAILDGLVVMGKRMLQSAGTAESLSQLGCRKACFVGTGALAAVATECALKTLELTAGSIYTMAESTMGLRHGPMSALDDDTLFVAFLSQDERRRKYEADLLHEIHTKQLGRARVAIAPAGSDESLRALCDHVIELNAPEEFPDDYRAPVDVIFGQMLGLFSSLEAGVQPDRPSPDGTINRVVSHVNLYL